MTERKPSGLSWESWVDRLIRDGIERGEFDNLAGQGKPIPDLDQPRDEMWWVKQKLRREEVSFLPPTLAVRKELEDALAQIEAADSEARVRTVVAEINDRIRYVNSHATSGPPSTLMPLDVETVVQRWRVERRDAET